MVQTQTNKFYNQFWFYCGLSLLLHLVTALLSEGIFHHDEYYQIIEFGSWKAGITPAQELAWEFGYHIRPSLQPWIVTAFIKLFGSDNPFTILFALRILCSVIAWAVIWIFVKEIYKTLSHPSEKLILLIMASFSGLIPFIHARFSSENVSALLFLVGVVLILRELKNKEITNAIISKNGLLVGLLLGLSIAIRLQTVLFLPGLALGLLFKKISLKGWLNLILGGVIGLLILVISDSLFYGKLVFTPYHYFYQNMVMGVASAFGTLPFWGYFSLSVHTFGVLAVLVWIIFFVAFVRNPKDIVLLSVFSFLLLHSAVGHKELRFLFPIVNFMPYIGLLFFREVVSVLNKSAPKVIAYPYFNIGLIVVSLALYIPQINNLVTKTANYSFSIYRFLDDNPLPEGSHFLARWDAPYNDRVDTSRTFNRYMPMRFLLQEKTHYHCDIMWWLRDINKYMDSLNVSKVYYMEKLSDVGVQNIQDSLGADKTVKIIYDGKPKWIEPININGWANRTSYPRLIEIKRISGKHL